MDDEFMISGLQFNRLGESLRFDRLIVQKERESRIRRIDGNLDNDRNLAGPCEEHDSPKKNQGDESDGSQNYQPQGTSRLRSLWSSFLGGLASQGLLFAHQGGKHFIHPEF